MSPSEVILIVVVVLVGAVALALTVYLLKLLRKNREGGLDHPSAKAEKVGKLPDDEHKNAEGVVRQLRRYAALHEYKVVAPVALNSVHGQADLDALLVGWFGVLGVKCLGYGGDVYGSREDEQWVQVINGNRRSFQNPLTRAQQSARVVRDVLFGAKLKNVPVETLVVFTGKSTQLKLPRSCGHYTEKTFAAYLKSSRFEEDKKVEVAPVAAALEQK